MVDEVIVLAITYYCAFFVWPAITVLLKETRNETGSYTKIVICNIFLSVYWFSFMATLFSALD